MALAASSAAGAAAILAPAAQADTFTVGNKTDNDPNSLRDAVAQANTTPGSDTVDASGISGTITLTTGYLAVDDSVTIIGPGAGSLTVSGDANGSNQPDPGDSSIFRISEVGSDEVNVAISGMTLAEGDDVNALYYGGAIGNQGAGLSLDHVSLTDNVGRGIGGALSSSGDGVISITNSDVSDNSSYSSGGGIFMDSYGPGSVTIEDTTMTGNQAGVGATPGSFSGYGGALTLTAQTAALNHVTITGNSAVGDGGGSVFPSPSALGPTHISVTDSTIRSNEASDGGAGGLSLSGGDLIRSTVSGNSAPDGTGGVSITSGSIRSSTVSGNTGRTGGVGAFAQVSPYFPGPAGVDIVDSTITGNIAKSSPGAYPPYSPYGGRGGGVLATGEKVSIANSTIDGNSANRGGGGVDAVDTDPSYADPVDDSDNATVISSSIVSNNTVSGSPGDLGTGAADPSGGVPDPGPNEATFSAVSSLIEVPAGAPLTNVGGTSKLGVDPQLGPLAANGGPTRTLLPGPGSPVIDAGVAKGLATDQRGFTRKVDLGAANSAGSDGTDIGAVERRAVEVDGVAIDASMSQKQKPKKIKIKVEVGAGEAVTAEAGGSLKTKGGKGKGGKGRLSAKKGKGKGVPLKSASASVPAHSSATLTLKLKKKSANGQIFKALKQGKKVSAKLQVTVTDAGGATVTKKPVVKLKLKKEKKGK
jgi:hypothetical protein